MAYEYANRIVQGMTPGEALMEEKQALYAGKLVVQRDRLQSLGRPQRRGHAGHSDRTHRFLGRSLPRDG